MIGKHGSATGYRPIPVMSDNDVLFMTQLSNDIVRSVNGINSIRQHGTRMRRRRTRQGHPATAPAPPRGDDSAYRSRASLEITTAAARMSREDTVASGGGSRRVRVRVYFLSSRMISSRVGELY